MECQQTSSECTFQGRDGLPPLPLPESWNRTATCSRRSLHIRHHHTHITITIITPVVQIGHHHQFTTPTPPSRARRQQKGERKNEHQKNNKKESNCLPAICTVPSSPKSTLPALTSLWTKTEQLFLNLTLPQTINILYRSLKTTTVKIKQDTA